MTRLVLARRVIWLLLTVSICGGMWLLLSLFINGPPALSHYDPVVNAVRLAQTRVISGGNEASRAASMVSCALPASQGAVAIFRGENAGEVAGYDVAWAGDVNQDGLDDFLIGAPYAEGRAGRAYLILGRQTLDWGQDFLLSQADASFVGEAAGDMLGLAVATAGDVNGDRLQDFLLGAPGNGRKGSFAGAAYLFFGRRAADWGTDLNIGNANVIFVGEASGDMVGDAIASAGDVNHDGFSDILIGAHLNAQGGTNAGKAYLILGRRGAAWPAVFDLSAADASFIGEGANSKAGTSVAGAADVNGDGFADLLIGAPGLGGGSAYLLLGGNPLPWEHNFDLESANAILFGEHGGDQTGCTVSAAGDVNQDGYGDFLIGAYFNDDGGDRSGKAYLLFGRRAANWGRNFSLANAMPRTSARERETTPAVRSPRHWMSVETIIRIS